MEHDKTEGYDTTPAARVRSGCAWLRDFAEVWGNQEAGSQYLLQPARSKSLGTKLRRAVRQCALKVCDDPRDPAREYDPETDADALAKGDVRLLTASVNAWLLGEGLAPIAGTPSSGNAAPAAPVEPTPAPSASVAGQDAGPEFSMLATRERLIQAFGPFTGMDASWFNNLKDTPALLRARKVEGTGGRGHTMEPWFCPFDVMNWLCSSRRKKGRPMQQKTGWRMLQQHFPKVYAAHEAEAPDPD